MVGTADGYREEHDLLGSMKVPADAYYGIHALRASGNFRLARRTVHPGIIKALAQVKEAAAKANESLGFLSPSLGRPIRDACRVIADGSHGDEFIVDALQGGAGTSTNMNVNEVVANLAIEALGGRKGEYGLVHPLDHVNLSQSTNDAYPTAVRVAAIRGVREASGALARLQEALQEKEHTFATVIKVGRTELQDALPIMLGQEFGAYAQAIARDRWRIYKAEERLRHINLGGTAVGTGFNADPGFGFLAAEALRELTGLPLARAEYTVDATQNCDVLAEVSGLVKAAAVNLAKISNDLRLMSSGPRAGFGEINLPRMQAGSSIMPGKVNPVVPEAIRQAAFQIMANDMAITLGAQAGELELNANLPLIAENLLQSLEFLTRSCDSLAEDCIKGITADEARCRSMVEGSLVFATALTAALGYERASGIARIAFEKGIGIREAALESGFVSETGLDILLRPYGLTMPGIPRLPGSGDKDGGIRQ